MPIRSTLTFVKRLINVTLLACLMACTNPSKELERCYHTNYDAQWQSVEPGIESLLNQLARFERFLIQQQALPAADSMGYRALLERIKADSPDALPNWADYCQQDAQCSRLTYPSAMATFVHCPQQVASNPLAEASHWAEQQGEVGWPYLERMLDALSAEHYEALVHRAPLLGSVAAILEGSRPAEQTVDQNF